MEGKEQPASPLEQDGRTPVLGPVIVQGTDLGDPEVVREAVGVEGAGQGAEQAQNQGSEQAPGAAAPGDPPPPPKTEPQKTSPNGNTNLEDLTPAQVRAHVNRLIDKVQAAALQRLLEMIPGLAILDAEGLVDAVVRLGDLKSSIEWTHEFKEQIKKNPALLTKGAKGALLNKVGGKAQQALKLAAGDGREQAQRTHKRVLGNLGNQELPQD